MSAISVEPPTAAPSVSPDAHADAQSAASSSPVACEPPAAAAPSSLVLSPAYESLWRGLTAACPQLPALTITCRGLAVEHVTAGHSADKEQQHGPRPHPTLARTLASKLRALDPRTWTRVPPTLLRSLSCASLSLRPGQTTLVLAPPGHGKTTLLRALAGRLHDAHGRSSLTRSGRVLDDATQIRWNGMTAAQMSAAGLQLPKLTAIVEQTDVHYPMLTVRETLRFALDASLADTRDIHSATNIQCDRDKLVDAVIQTIGLSECADTAVGSAYVRGVSGGQRRRVSLGEMLLGCPRALLLDEVTNGLDASTAFALVQSMKRWAAVARAPVCMALLQPTPEMVDSFDQLVLLLHGNIVFAGSVAELRAHWTSVGIPLPPEGKPIAEYAVEMLSNPAEFIQKARMEQARQQHAAAATHKNIPLARVAEDEHGDAAAAPSGSSSSSALDAHKSAAESEPGIVRFHLDDVDDSPTPRVAANGSDIAAASGAPLLHSPAAVAASFRSQSATSEGMLADWQASAMHLRMMERIDAEHALGDRRLAQLQSEAASLTPFLRRQFYRPSSLSFWAQCGMLLGRESKAVLRGLDVLIYRLVQAVLLGLVVGSLFFDLGSLAKDASLRLSLIFLSLIIIAFGGMSEVPNMIQFKHTVLKQTEAGFFGEYPYMISAAISALPVATVEAVLFGSILYFMTSFAAEAGRFFFFLLLQLLMGLALFSFFRVVAFVVDTADIAIAVVNPVTGAQILFSGFLLTRKKIADWLIWLYYTSPFTWAFNSLALNEFESPRYTDGHGEDYLRAFEIPVDPRGKWAAVGVLLLAFVLCSTAAALLLRAAKGKRTSPGGGSSHQQGAGATSSNPSPGLDGVDGDGAVVVDVPSSAADADAESDGSSLPFERMSLSFKDVCYFVDVPAGDKSDDKRTVSKRLLNHVTGFAMPGTVTALSVHNNTHAGELAKQPPAASVSHDVLVCLRVLLSYCDCSMGSSGAGKTTLLDVLGQRKSTGTVTGTVRLNGRLMGAGDRAGRVLAYGEQADHHFPLSTVQESIEFSAHLRLSSSVTADQRRSFVSNILRELELRHLAGRLVNTLTAGEKKRLTIGVELASNAPILFLDEPTTGLDSRSAAVVMRVVHRIAQTGRTIICTVHQPSREVFLLFDRLLLLQSGGQCVYFGDVGRCGQPVVDHLTSLPMPPPHKAVAPPVGGAEDLSVNVASWMLDVVQPGGIEDASAQDIAQPPPFAELYKQSELCARNQRTQDQMHSGDEKDSVGAASSVFASSAVGSSGSSDSEHAQSLWVQFVCVFSRLNAQQWRSGELQWAKLLPCLILGLVLGVAFYRISDDDTAGLQSKLSCLFSAVLFAAITVAAGVVPPFFNLREAFYRETTSRVYSPLVHAVSFLLVETPYVFAGALLLGIPFYWLVGLSADVGSFFYFLLILFSICLIWTALQQCFCAVSPSAVVAVMCSDLFVMFAFLFAGLFVPKRNIPKGWIWFYYLNPLPKAFIAATLPQWPCSADSGSGSGCAVVETLDGVGTKAAYVESFVGGSDGAQYDNLGYLAITLLVLDCAFIAAVTKISFRSR